MSTCIHELEEISNQTANAEYIFRMAVSKISTFCDSPDVNICHQNDFHDKLHSIL